jgi:PIN domain nuclease of toxin-antitoxin system
VKLLLDTHIWLWSHLAPEKLSRRVARALENPSSELWLSPISIWELVMLSANRKVVLDEGVGAWVRRTMEVAPMHEAPVSYDIALAVADVALPHRDLADRLLIATARVLDLTLVTGDHRILDHARSVALLGN